MATDFATRLLAWHRKNPRPLPWDGGPRDPYHIWISEIIMQQTRIEQGAPYYLKFANRFPTVNALAAASQDQVMRYWQGLGYYSRARNLHKAAQYIVNDLEGQFPNTFDDLKQLPGVGDYTAAAIASFAYGLPHPVVDGNVKRVLSRYDGFTDSIDESRAHQKLVALAAKHLKESPPAVFNQAIMNFGAMVCTPKSPDCSVCPLSKKCYARKNAMVDELPLRSKKKTNTIRHFHFIVLSWKDKTLLTRRDQKDIWNGLYTPLIIESKSTRKPSAKKIASEICRYTGTDEVLTADSTDTTKQLLSHQTIYGRFHHYILLEKPKIPAEGFVWATKRKLDSYPKPRMIAAEILSLFV